MSICILAAGGRTTSILMWSAVLFVLVIVGFVIVAAVRKHFQADDEGPAVGGLGFTIQQLRQMRRDGEITDEQFETLREQMIGVYKPSEPKDDQGDADQT